jgi:hypothetical protein
MAVKVVLHLTVTPMRGPELVPHGRTPRGVLVDHQFIDNSSLHPIAPVKSAISHRRPKNIAPRHTHSQPLSFLAESRTQFRWKRGKILAKQVPPCLDMLMRKDGSRVVRKRQLSGERNAVRIASKKSVQILFVLTLSRPTL